MVSLIILKYCRTCPKIKNLYFKTTNKMKTITLSILVIITSFAAFGQKEAPKLPIDSLTSKITYSEVVYVDSLANKQELFSRAREWFAKAYKSSTNVIQLEDKESGKILGKALIQVYHKSMGSNYPSGYINYTISIYVKDGRYKYEVTDFYHTGQNQIPDYGVCEKMINTTDKTMGMSYQKYYNYYLYQMDNNINELIAGLKTNMAVNSGGAKEESW
jgi:hypothetical protein